MRINEISDPYLRDRLVLPQPPSSGKKWLLIFPIILFIIIVLLVMGGYFFPQKLEVIQAFFAKEAPPEEVPILNPVVPESYKDSTVTSTTASLTESFEFPEELTATAPVSENNPPPIVQETAEVLIARAQEQLRRQRFTSPPGNNAYETSQQLAKIAPQPAQEIVDTMTHWYLEQGQKYLRDKDRLLQPEQRSAFEMYQRAQELAPENPQVKEGIDKIVQECHRLALDYQKAGKLAQGLTVVEKGLRLKPQDKELLQLKEQLENRE
jgi:hypothetical protein